MHTVVITDHVFASLSVERELLGAIGATIVPLQARSEDDLMDEISAADALLVCSTRRSPCRSCSGRRPRKSCAS